MHHLYLIFMRVHVMGLFHMCSYTQFERYVNETCINYLWQDNGSLWFTLSHSSSLPKGFIFGVKSPHSCIALRTHVMELSVSLKISQIPFFVLFSKINEITDFFFCVREFSTAVATLKCLCHCFFFAVFRIW